VVRIYPVARRLAIFVASLAAAHAVAAPALAEEGVYTPSAAHDLPVLEALVVRRLPRLQEPLLAVDVARSEARQAGLLPNPEIDLAWGTIPLGASNPRDLPAPLANVPNYTVGLSYTFPIGKRGPRRARAEALVEGAQRSVEATARAEALGLVRVLGRVAIARLRLEGLRGLVAQQRTMIELARSRLAQGFGTPLDVDRLEIELSRIEQQLTSTRGDEVAGLAACAGYVGVPCRPLGGEAEARVYVLAWLARGKAASAALERRPDVRALAALQTSAASEADLARAQALPDPTVRLAYTHDRFVASGNQMNSLTLSVSIPVPLFDRGQAQLDAAEARRARYDELRRATLRRGAARVVALRELLALLEERQAALVKILPRAQAALEDLLRASNSRLIPLTDVIQARRTLDELLVQQADAYSDAFQATADLLEESAP